MKTNRTGKIARLPLVVREELNRRIEDGWSGRRLVRWLNELPEVRAILEAEFGGKRILEQNLTAWKQGGYREWMQRREAMELAGRFREEWQMLEERNGKRPGSEMQDGPTVRPGARLAASDGAEPHRQGRASTGQDGRGQSLAETLALWTVGRLCVATRDVVAAAEWKKRWWMMREMVGHVCKLRGVEQAEQRARLQERRVELARMKCGMPEGGMAEGLGSPPRRQDAKEEMEGGRGVRCGVESRGISEEGGQKGEDGKLSEIALGGMKTDSQVAEAQGDQGKSRQIKVEKSEAGVREEGSAGMPSRSFRVDPFDVAQGGSRLGKEVISHQEGSDQVGAAVSVGSSSTNHSLPVTDHAAMGAQGGSRRIKVEDGAVPKSIAVSSDRLTTEVQAVLLASAPLVQNGVSLPEVALKCASEARGWRVETTRGREAAESDQGENEEAATRWHEDGKRMSLRGRVTEALQLLRAVRNADES